jgi:hypothetical protein
MMIENRLTADARRAAPQKDCDLIFSVFLRALAVNELEFFA